MSNLIVIGAGQIGSRHLQALSLLDNTHKIWVVDPNQAALALAEKRYEEVSSLTSRVVYSKDIPLGQSFDLAIIATSAEHRFAAFKKLLDDNHVFNVIFEKVLFQRLSQIDECAELIKQNNIMAWVNCPRRTYDSYAKLKASLCNAEHVEMIVSGTNYGLGCNGIHFIDLFSFFSEEPIISIEQTLNNEIINAKRKGCFEVFGQLDVASKNSTLKMSCEQHSDQQSEFKVSFIDRRNRFEVDEISRQLKVYSLDDELLHQLPFFIPMQSDLTHHYVLNILSNSNCSLPSFNDSAQQHKHFLGALTEHFDTVYPARFDLCPIS